MINNQKFIFISINQNLGQICVWHREFCGQAVEIGTVLRIFIFTFM